MADGELEIGGRLPVDTDGGLIANGEPKVGYTQLYGAPGVAGVSILSV